ncbi:hypothetical protein ACH5RR_032452 [Cinchona calisaya]|uniref:Uncharacterized protein n=1 Tax=Cinchona calisaya TaxID=153742 RepID=A0ABD2YMC5_9GENT
MLLESGLGRMPSGAPRVVVLGPKERGGHKYLRYLGASGVQHNFYSSTKALAYVFIFCPFLSMIWSQFATNCGLKLASVHLVLQQLNQWCIWSTNEITQLIPIAIYWVIWKARNEAYIIGTIPILNRLFHNIICFLQDAAFVHPFKCSSEAIALANDNGIPLSFAKSKWLIPMLISWSKPSAHELKVNVDGFAAGDLGQMGGGEVC